jgi:hypothetical protein
MKQFKVGKIKNFKYNLDEDTLEITISISDPKFKKKIIRDLSLNGQLSFENDKLIFTPSKEDSDADL